MVEFDYMRVWGMGDMIGILLIDTIRCGFEV
jgi:hypothetical protein